MSRFVKFAIGICIIAVCGLAGVYGTRLLVAQGSDTSAKETAEPRAIRVGVTSPTRQTISNTVSAVGTLRPIKSVEIVPIASGRVTQVAVASGDRVAQGDLLIQLDDRAARAALADAQATLDETRQNYDRFRQLQDSNVAADARLEETRAAFRRAEAAVMMAEADLEDRAITAPFAGTLGVIDTEEGAFLNNSDPVTRLVDRSRMEISVTLSERYYDQVKEGLTLQIKTPAYPDETFEGQVTLRSPEIDLATRSFEIRAQIDNPDRRLVGGMFANSSLVLNTYDGLAIPDDAIISQGLATYVYTVKDSAAVRTNVTLGSTLGEMTEVRKGLNTNARIVIAGWDQLADNAKVQEDENFNAETIK